MYKMISILIILALFIASSVVFAQEFSFKPPPIPSTSGSSPSLSPEDFAKSSTQAYQEQQAKISALAGQKAQTAQMNKAKAATAASKPALDATQKPMTTMPPQLNNEPQKPMPQESPSRIASPTPAETPSTPTPATQPYTGFQSPPPKSGGNYNSDGTPANNNQNSGGWGSSIKY